ncbi:MAG: nucleotidyl transferase AbiEii/AbiGii toxin family protein [Candidatus Sabulitectum sp.]|nr:nucleotidyl transferase AbiEii/AbiGii toxin family protein [Candidatus Sabulitectum sp.]
MENTINYKQLYALQDKVLSVVFALENSFYLTGGTALHRFYYNARYSDDLDFFTSSDNLFGESINEILDGLEGKYSLNHLVSARDFHRVLVNNLLQLDFVNDRVYRQGKSNIIGSIRVDNKVNILANKVTAIVGRDEGKDVFDLFYLARHEEFTWDDILHIANKKSIVEKEILINRLSSFPLQWLENIKMIKHFEISKDMLNQLCKDILIGQNNSFYKPI